MDDDAIRRLKSVAIDENFWDDDEDGVKAVADCVAPAAAAHTVMLLAAWRSWWRPHRRGHTRFIFYNLMC